MKQYSEVTPSTQLMDGSYDLDALSSSYINVRFGVPVVQLVTVSAKYAANLPGLAFDFYGSVDYWRAILAFNGLQDPVSDVQVGVVLGLPDQSGLQAFLAATNEDLTQTIVS
jgi:hypothetical protein